MINKKLNYLACLSATLFLANQASAQDSHWSGLGSGGLWSDPNNWSPVGVPPTGGGGFVGNVFLDAANGVSVINIAAGDTESPGVGSPEEFDTIFGPEWGVTLNIAGTLNFDWLLFPVQNSPTPGIRSYLNLSGNANVTTSGAALGIGDAWFYHDAPFVTMNLYNHSQYNSLGGAGLWLGGHINIYDTSSFLVNGYINMDFERYQSDGTRSLNVAGGTLTMPEGYINGNNSTYDGAAGDVHDFIRRGIVRVYGKGYDTNDLVITDNGVNTIVTAMPLGGALQRVYFQPLLHASVGVGTFQQITLSGDYPSMGGVLLSSSEPGLSPSSFPQPLYTSSNPGVAAVDANGMVTALSPGTTTISAKVGTFTSTNTVTLTVVAKPNLLHEYKFSETSGTTAADSVPGNSPTWDATLVGGVTLGSGQAVLDGSSGYIQLPAGILTNQDEVTIETWASFATPINIWANLFAFGNTDNSTFSATFGDGENYITFQPHTGNTNMSANIGIGDPGSAGELDATAPPTLDGVTNAHIVVLYHPLAGTEAIYINGNLMANFPLFNNLVDPVAYAGPTFNGQSVVNQTLGTDPLNYIGKSLYNSDPTLNGSIDEFRIYDGALTPAQIKADSALGPNQFIGSSTNVSLTATVSGGNVTVKWPTSSALVNLMTSPTLGAGASWTPAAGTLNTSGGNYQMTMPAGGAVFFRLQL